MRRPLVKICGLSRSVDLALALQLGADFLGFVIAPDSPRGLNEEQAARLIAKTPSASRCVLVLRSLSRARVFALSASFPRIRFQLHGFDESLVQELEARGQPLLKTCDANEMSPSAAASLAPSVLDLGPGGGGQPFDWRRLHPQAPEGVFIAGGIRPETLPTLLRFAPWGIDLSSGVESSPGHKCPQRLHSLFRILDESCVMHAPSSFDESFGIPLPSSPPAQISMAIEPLPPASPPPTLGVAGQPDLSRRRTEGERQRPSNGDRFHRRSQGAPGPLGSIECWPRLRDPLRIGQPIVAHPSPIRSTVSTADGSLTTPKLASGCRHFSSRLGRRQPRLELDQSRSLHNSRCDDDATQIVFHNRPNQAEDRPLGITTAISTRRSTLDEPSVRKSHSRRPNAPPIDGRGATSSGDEES